MQRAFAILLLTAPAALGAGDSQSLGCGCDPGTGTVMDGDGDGYGATIDCDDADPNVHPSAEEHCDGVDEDCDGEVDEEAVDAVIWMQDLDDDGWGGVKGEESCEPPSGYVAEGGDCHESDPDIHPGATELCCDEVDQDCDGDFDNGCSGDLVLLGETTDAFAGEVLARVGDLDGDGLEDLAVGAPEADSGGVNADGRVYVVYGRSDLESGQELVLLDESSLYWDLGATLGASLAGGMDLDGDGYGDLAIGAPHKAQGADVLGAVYLAYGPVSDTSGDDWGGVTILGRQLDAYWGEAVAGSSDLTGDGLDDLAISAPYHVYDHQAGDAGMVGVFSGPLEGTLVPDDADLLISGTRDLAPLGTLLDAGGDHNGDGQADLLISYDTFDFGGKVMVLDGPAEGNVSITDVGAFVSNCETHALFASSMGWAGDTNGDGYDDFVVGAPTSEAGKVYLFHGPWDSPATCDDADGIVSGTAEDGEFGSAIAADLDVDGDGHPDLAVSAASGVREPCDYETNAVFLWSGPIEGAMEDSSADRVFVGDGTLANLGFTLAGVDLTGDGRDELAMGAPGTNVFNLDEGAVWIALGSEL